MPVYPLQYNTVTGEIVAQQILSGGIGSGSIQSGSLGAGAVLSANIASGQVGVGHFQSGAVQSGGIGNAAVVSGNLGSGQIGGYHFASGQVLPPLTVSGGFNLQTLSAGNSETYAVFISAGVVQTNKTLGPPSLEFKANTHPVSGRIGSGAGWGILLVPSEDFVELRRDDAAPAGSSVVTTNAYHFGSGGFTALSGYWALSSLIGSGQIGRFHIASGAITSGAIASGQAQPNALASGAVLTQNLASGVVVSGNIASGQIGGNHIAGAGLISGNIGSGTFPGDILISAAFIPGNVRIFAESGTVNYLGIGFPIGPPLSNAQPWFIGMPDTTFGQFVLRTAANFNNLLGAGINAYVFGSGGATATSGFGALSGWMGSGQIGGAHLAAGAVLSANIASGQIGINHLAIQAKGELLLSSYQIGFPATLSAGFPIPSGIVAIRIQGIMIWAGAGAGSGMQVNLQMNGLTSGLYSGTLGEVDILTAGNVYIATGSGLPVWAPREVGDGAISGMFQTNIFNVNIPALAGRRIWYDSEGAGGANVSGALPFVEGAGYADLNISGGAPLSGISLYTNVSGILRSGSMVRVYGTYL